MKKLFFIYCLVAMTVSAFSQSFTLELSNPYPRIGDNVSVEYEINPIQPVYGDVLDKRSKPVVVGSCHAPDYTIAKGSFELTQELDSIRNYTVGPLSITIDGVQYESNALTFSVQPKLPEVTTGFWVNFIKFNDDYYLILEQRIPGWINSAFLHNLSESTNNPFAEIVFDALKSIEKRYDDIVILQPKSSTSQRSVKGRRNEKSKYTQKRTVYKVWLSDDYDDSFVLTKDLFKNLPEEFNYEPILIKK